MAEKKRQRRLTGAEQLRKKRFEAAKAQLQGQGYEADDLTLGALYVNVMALVLGLPVVLALGVGFLIRNPAVSLRLGRVNLLGFLLVFLLLIVVHELIHGLSWALFAKGHWQAISFGFIVRSVTPYCTCGEALKKGQYLFGAFMPTLLLGLLPALIAVFTGSPTLFFLGALMILSGGGDLAIILKLLRHRGRAGETLYLDHPYECGLVAFSR